MFAVHSADLSNTYTMNFPPTNLTVFWMNPGSMLVPAGLLQYLGHLACSSRDDSLEKSTFCLFSAAHPSFCVKFNTLFVVFLINAGFCFSWTPDSSYIFFYPPHFWTFGYSSDVGHLSSSLLFIVGLWLNLWHVVRNRVALQMKVWKWCAGFLFIHTWDYVHYSICHRWTSNLWLVESLKDTVRLLSWQTNRTYGLKQAVNISTLFWQFHFAPSY